MQTRHGALLVGDRPHDIVSFLKKPCVIKKQEKRSVVSQSSIDLEYMAITNVTLKLVWIRDLLKEIAQSVYETIW